MVKASPVYKPHKFSNDRCSLRINRVKKILEVDFWFLFLSKWGTFQRRRCLTNTLNNWNFRQMRWRMIGGKQWNENDSYVTACAIALVCFLSRVTLKVIWTKKLYGRTNEGEIYDWYQFQTDIFTYAIQYSNASRVLFFMDFSNVEILDWVFLWAMGCVIEFRAVRILKSIMIFREGWYVWPGQHSGLFYSHPWSLNILNSSWTLF